MNSCHLRSSSFLIVLLIPLAAAWSNVLIPGKRNNDLAVSSTFRCLTCPEPDTQTLVDMQTIDGTDPSSNTLQLDGARASYDSSFGIVDDFVHSVALSVMSDAPIAFSEFGGKSGKADTSFAFTLEQQAEFQLSGRIRFDSPVPIDLGTYSGSIELLKGDVSLVYAAEDGRIEESGRLAAGDYEMILKSEASASSIEYGAVSIDLQMSFLSVQTEGDFDGDGLLTATDIDLLALFLREQRSSSVMDVTNDGRFDQMDRLAWITDAANTYLGDSNLDGRFDSSDFVVVFQAGHYEDEIDSNSGWAEGDWNGDGEFSSEDFIAAFNMEGYEKAPRVGMVSVPEPRSICMMLVSCCLLSFGRSRRA